MRLTKILLVAFAVIVGAFLLLFILVRVFFPKDGSVEHALAFKAKLAEIKVVDGAIVGELPDPAVKHDLRDRSWVVTMSLCSHKFQKRGGGTLAVLDSTGRIRVFFGHVCGAEYFSSFLFGRNFDSLTEFYAELSRARFIEQEL